MEASKLYRYELVFLSLLVLALPSLEALKTFFWFVYVCLFVAGRLSTGTLELLPRRWPNIAIVLFLSATLVSTLVNWPFDNGIKGFADELRYCSLFLCLYNGGYSEKTLRNLAYLAIVGVIGGLIYGLVEFLLGMRPEMQFHSAGILTQSSIYLGIAIILTTSLILDSQKNSPMLTKYLSAAWLIQVIALMYMGSRGSLLAVTLLLMIIAVMKFRIKAVLSIISILALLVAGGLVMLKVFPDNVVSNYLQFQYSPERIKKSDAERMQIWHLPAAKLKTGEDLVWGIGPRNYKSLEDEDFVRNSETLSKIKNFHHAHNLFLTHLIEQGIVGLFSMLLFFALVITRLISVWRLTPGHDPEWWWYAGLGGFFVPLIAGMFNTPYYQEHAMFSMLVIGMLFGISTYNKHLAPD